MTETQDVLVWNFGPGPFYSFDLRPRPPEPDQVIEVPASGVLEEIGLGTWTESQAGGKCTDLTPEKSGASIPCVTISLPTDDPNDIDQSVYLTWSPNRQEWVAIRYHRWRENGYSDDVYYSGPYALDPFCEDSLAVAYGLEPSAQCRGVFRHLPPEKLRSIASTPRMAVAKRGIGVSPQQIFISYVREDARAVRKLGDTLIAVGHKVFIDRESLEPGVDWKLSIRKAIETGVFFVACFSRHTTDRTVNYMNEELNIAIERMRLMPDDAVWFIPVLLSECTIPQFEIRPGKALDSKQWVDLHSNWTAGIDRLLRCLRK